jgi:hypothetical protein
MTEHAPTPDAVLHHPEWIHGYTYATDEAARSPLTLEELRRLKEAVWLTPDDEQALRAAAWILADRADDMVTAWRARLAEQPWLATRATPTAPATRGTAPRPSRGSTAGSLTPAPARSTRTG